MFFFLTNFIHPIKKSMPLSKYFQFTFDNPRSREEIETVRKLIQKSWDLSEIAEGFQYKRLPMEAEVRGQDLVTFERLIKEFYQKYFGKKEAEKRMKKFEGNKEAIIDFYTRYWVIVRYETEEMVKEDRKFQVAAQKMRKRGDYGFFFLLDDEHIFERREKHLIDYSSLISLLSAREEYFGWNFLITKSREEVETFSPNIHVMDNILRQAIAVKSSRTNDPHAQEFDFKIFIDSVADKIKILDEKLDSAEISEDSILYIGDALGSVQPIENEFSALVRLVSIIEMLLTHQPDYSRFNVEESITKQFILKTAILVQQQDPKVNLEEIRLGLKEIYSQRSNIVHGNFSAVNKFIATLKKKDRYFSELVADAYRFARIVLDSYIQQPQFIDFLKEN